MMKHRTPDTPTYKHVLIEGGIESFVRIPIEDLMEAAARIESARNLSLDILDATSKIMRDETSGLSRKQLDQGHALLMMAIDLIIPLEPSAPHSIQQAIAPSYIPPTLRRTALKFLHDPAYTEPILELVKNQTPHLRAKDGNWDDEDLKAITFLILERTENPGEFVKTLTQTFQMAPPEHTVAQRLFTNILLERVRNYIALQEKSAEPAPQHRYPA